MSFYRVAALSLAFLVIPFLPAMNIFFRVGFVIAERNIYISSIGFVMIVVVGLLLLGTNDHFRTVSCNLIETVIFYLIY